MDWLMHTGSIDVTMTLVLLLLAAGLLAGWIDAVCLLYTSPSPRD